MNNNDCKIMNTIFAEKMGALVMWADQNGWMWVWMCAVKFSHSSYHFTVSACLLIYKCLMLSQSIHCISVATVKS